MSEFGNKEFIIWATVSSRSCFCWLYRAFPSLVAKNIINLISILTIWWCPCIESSLVLLEEGICYNQCILLVKICFVLQGQICLLLQVSPDFLLLHSSPLWWKGHLFWMLVLKGLVGLHRTVQLQLLQHYWLGHRLGLLWYWIVCLRNERKSFCLFFFFEVAHKYCISDSFVEYEGYSISSRGFLSTVVDIIVIWVKFAHSGPF